MKMNTSSPFFQRFTRAICAVCLIVCAIFCTLATAEPLIAQEMPVPVRLHVALLNKVLSFSRSLKGTPKVVVVYTDASSNVKDEATKSFGEIGLSVSAMKVEQAMKGLGEANIVYVAPGAGAIEKICEQQGVLSITGIPALVETGKVAVGIGTESGKPKVLVHLLQTKAQKQEFAPDLIRVARVIQ